MRKRRNDLTITDEIEQIKRIERRTKMLDRITIIVWILSGFMMLLAHGDRIVELVCYAQSCLHQ